MIELYYWPTPNGHKISIALEEMGLAYEVKPINIGAGDQNSFEPSNLAAAKIGMNNWGKNAFLLFRVKIRISKNTPLFPYPTPPAPRIVSGRFISSPGGSYCNTM